jgi:hypothetical protein
LTYGLRWELNRAPHAGGGPKPVAFTQVEEAARLSLAAPGAPLPAFEREHAVHVPQKEQGCERVHQAAVPEIEPTNLAPELLHAGARALLARK